MVSWNQVFELFLLAVLLVQIFSNMHPCYVCWNTLNEVDMEKVIPQLMHTPENWYGFFSVRVYGALLFLTSQFFLLWSMSASQVSSEKQFHDSFWSYSGLQSTETVTD